MEVTDDRAPNLERDPRQRTWARPGEAGHLLWLLNGWPASDIDPRAWLGAPLGFDSLDDYLRGYGR